MASLFKRGKRYYVRVCVNGKARDIATKTTNRKLAEKVRQKIEYEDAAGVLETATRTKLQDLLTSFVEHLKVRLPSKSVANDLSRLRRLFGAIVPALETPRAVKPVTDSPLAVTYAEQITPPLINQRLDERAKDISPKTVNEEREILHRLFNYAIDFHGLVHPDRRYANPVTKVKRRRTPAPEIRFLTRKQITEQLKTLKSRPVLRTAVAIMIYAGLRRSEALWLTRSDIDRKRRMISVAAKTVDGESWQAKTARNRTVPINTDLAAVLTGYRPMLATGWYLPSPEGQRYDPDNFSHALAAVNDKHGLPWTCLDFRHTFGSILAQRGVSLYKISAMMGNSPEICRRHYAALIPDEFAGDAEFHDPPALRLVHRDGHVEVAKAYYSLPPEYVGRTVWVRWDGRLVRILDHRLRPIIVHVRQEPGRFSTDPGHLHPHKVSAVERGAGDLLHRTRFIGPHTHGWSKAMLDARGIEGVRVLVGLHAMAKQHPSEVLEETCEIAHSHGAYRLRAIRELIRRRGPTQDRFEFMDAHPIIRTLDEYTAAARRAIRQHDERDASPARTIAARSEANGAGDQDRSAGRGPGPQASPRKGSGPGLALQ